MSDPAGELFGDGLGASEAAPTDVDAFDPDFAPAFETPAPSDDMPDVYVSLSEPPMPPVTGDTDTPLPPAPDGTPADLPEAPEDDLVLVQPYDPGFDGPPPPAVTDPSAQDSGVTRPGQPGGDTTGIADDSTADEPPMPPVTGDTDTPPPGDAPADDSALGDPPPAVTDPSAQESGVIRPSQPGVDTTDTADDATSDDMPDVYAGDASADDADLDEAGAVDTDEDDMEEWQEFSDFVEEGLGDIDEAAVNELGGLLAPNADAAALIVATADSSALVDVLRALNFVEAETPAAGAADAVAGASPQNPVLLVDGSGDGSGGVYRVAGFDGSEALVAPLGLDAPPTSLPLDTLLAGSTGVARFEQGPHPVAVLGLLVTGVSVIGLAGGVAGALGYKYAAQRNAPRP